MAPSEVVHGGVYILIMQEDAPSVMGYRLVSLPGLVRRVSIVWPESVKHFSLDLQLEDLE
jgi:hypothetical protein